MLQHDITNNEYYHDGVEITAEDYAELYQEWLDNLPEPAEPVPYDKQEADAKEIEEALEGIL